MFRSHQVPLARVREDPARLAALDAWLRSYEPERFDGDGASAQSSRRSPNGDRRMEAEPHANGGLLLRALGGSDFRTYAVDVPSPAASTSEATRVLGTFLRDIVAVNSERFRIMGPDETASNRLGASSSSRQGLGR